MAVGKSANSKMADCAKRQPKIRRIKGQNTPSSEEFPYKNVFLCALGVSAVSLLLDRGNMKFVALEFL